MRTSDGAIIFVCRSKTNTKSQAMSLALRSRNWGESLERASRETAATFLFDGPSFDVVLGRTSFSTGYL